MRIYTRGGDQGETGLFGGSRIGKASSRIAAYGEMDELNSVLGWAAVVQSAPEGAGSSLADLLRREQGKLMILSSWLATPEESKSVAKLPPWPEDGIAELEREMDAWETGLQALTEFLLPGGAEASARLHFARAVCRRAERWTVAFAEEESPPEAVVPYLNRLGDWLFVAAREANRRAGQDDLRWRP